jgi:exopolysaccharide biosynthesis polyprenyl glycosylphosphotransferase
MPNETRVTEPGSKLDSETGSTSRPEEGVENVRFRRSGSGQPSDPGSGVRTVNGKSVALVEHQDVKRDVRAPRPRLLGTLVRAHVLGRLGRLASLLALDLGALWAAIFSALALKELIRGNFVFDRVAHTTWEYLPFVFLVTALLFARSRLYGPREVRPGLTAIVSGLFWVAVVSLAFALVNGLDFRSYYVFYGGLFFGLIWVGSLRWLYEKATGLALRMLGRRRRAILVGSGDQIEAVGRALSADGSPTPYEPIGYISLTPRPENGLRDLGGLDDLPALIDEHRVHEVIIADPDFPQHEAFELVDRCHDRGVAVRIAPTTMEIMTREHQLVPGQTVPLFELKPPVFEGVDFVIKRTFDFVGAGFLMLVLSPVFGSIALAIKLTSRGPVMFRSRRPGIGGQPFNCLKFRTMQSKAEQRQSELEDRNEASGALFKMRSDPRLTPIGGFLRRFSLDELPQLVNVLRGEMSLVGPRPLPQRDYDRLEDWHRKRYLVLPGITGLWQVSGRAELDFDELVRLDFLYLERWSVFLDMSILLKTVPAVLTRKGAF